MMASTIKSSLRFYSTVAILAATGTLAACGPALLGGAYIGASNTGLFEQDDSLLIEKSYAAADYLIQQADAFVDRRKDLIIVEPLADTVQPLASPDINRRIPEQIGVRLSQLGYRLDLSKVAGSDDTRAMQPTLTTNEKPDFILSGSTTRKGREMDVSLRIVDLKAQRVVANFDYIMEISGKDVRESAKPKPKIMRVTEE